MTGRSDGPRRRVRSRRPQVSWSTRGRCLLAGGIATGVCALVLDERDLLTVGVFITALPVLALLLVYLAKAAARAQRRLDPARLSVGSATTARIALRRSGPAWLGALQFGQLLLTDAVPEQVSGTGRYPTFQLARLPRGAAAELAYPIRPVLRGRYSIGPLTAHGTDPLALAEFALTITRPSALLVLPRVVGLSGLPASLGNDLLDSPAARRQHGPGSADLTVREYRHGDELRRVHWRSTARQDELMVRVEERARRGGVTIMLDRRRLAHRGQGPLASIEWAVSFVASGYVHLARRGIAVTLVTEDGVPVAGGHREIDAVLDALAELPLSATGTLSGVALPGAGADAMIAVLVALDEEDPARLVRRAPTPAGHAVLLDVSGWSNTMVPAAGDVGSAAESLRGAGWTTSVARAGTGVDLAWQRVCAARPVTEAVRQ